ncbi:Formylglycine-generating enzyme, required for sulfatase activity, contains SUMF1/FGE domain [Robiginitalea myxolifaciens]|uniref:Formylglycine-generating enzyme, required for sulfatase activity, contains SUMF1/FGE domain n=1 Tax=Robiginitalea myxolifaciens TaxID=400055 RepID=A0A1I6HAV6_9FLAO|nr:SUMF1/EgtB/PvdO family nonheme iron enzyme [Robiginitalea myxolifaciens]SFR51504.1 Formylglycine-generating enzyme, required for sulfatase activity, contains SUMF1/FGE domain [Robiginitalea myxolifaciens]
MRPVTFLSLLFLLFHSASFSKSRYESSSRAKIEILSNSRSGTAGIIKYYDYWNDQTNSSALYVFFKQGSRSVPIVSISLENFNFSAVLSSDKSGFFVVPNKNTESQTCIDFRISFQDSEADILPHCLEMVYIPQGKFYLGDPKSFEYRNSKSTSRGSLGAPLNAFFKSGINGTFDGTYIVDSEKEILIGECDGCLNYQDAEIPGVNTYSGDKKGVLPKKFPKGFSSFYQMRYELTEQQYCNFLNSLSPSQAARRIDINDTFQGGTRRDYGNFITFNEGKFVTTRPNQACSFISWNDCLAYADWAGLRIMTELEFEKSSRGPVKPKFREYSWGGSEIENQFFLDKNLFPLGEGDFYVDGNIHVNYLGFNNYKDVCGDRGSDPDYGGCRNLSSKMTYRGPLQTGIHAKEKSVLNRVTTGSGYYGTLDLSGNVREPVIPVGNSYSRQYEGTVGDGILSEEGKSNSVDWHYASGTDLVFGYRGGSWSYHENHGRIADRFCVYRKGVDIRTPYSGFRGVKD